MTRVFWDEALHARLSEYFIDNLTDFNDSTCFTYFIGTDGCRFKIGGDALHRHLESGHTAYYVKLQISCRAPMLCVFFCKYDGSRTAFQTSDAPYTQEQEKLYSELLQFATENRLEPQKYSDLVNRMILEDGRRQSAYSCYFEADE